MKKIPYKFFLFILCITSFLSNESNAQSIGKFLGTTAAGGTYSGGALFKFDPNNSSYTRKDFEGGPKRPAFQSVIKATDGNFYGMTYYTGDYATNIGKGTLYKMDTNGIVTVLNYFTGTNGATPLGNVMQASDGNLYGMTQQGGTANAGVLFKCTLSGTYTVLKNFNTSTTSTATGCYPDGELIEGFDGFLYGLTQAGGSSNKGTIFKCSTTGTFTRIFSFTGAATGSTPFGSLVQGVDSLLYGMTYDGGTSNLGAIFKCTTTGVFTKLKDLNATTGINPGGTLILGIDSLFYGMTYEGGDSLSGTIFKISSSGVFHKIYDFSNATGTCPNSNLVQDSNGFLYGTTTGYQNPAGYYWLNSSVVFKADTVGNVQVLFSPNPSLNGYSMYGPLSLVDDSILYGATQNGGNMGSGTLFTCSTTGNFNTIFHMGFCSTPLGNTPVCTPILATDGNVYGCASFGGSYGVGSVFKYDTTLNVLSTIANFDGPNGSNAIGVIQASDGNLWGMTTAGGDSSEGVIFKCTTSGTITVMKSLYTAIGNGPNTGNLLEASDGNFYGLTMSGGDSLGGVLFQLTPAGVYTVLVHFYNAIGSNPTGGLIQASDGNLYGMTQGGGDSAVGTLFKCTLTGTLTVLSSFHGVSDGANPQGTLLQGSDGNLYGMCYQGGLNWMGTIFKSSLTGVVTKIIDFNGANGGYPFGELIEAPDGNFYGMTSGGGTSSLGTIIKLTPTGSLSVLKSFNSTLGSSPYGGLLLLPNPLSVFENNSDLNFAVYPNPATSEINILLSTNENTVDGQIFVTDIQGKKLISLNQSAIMNGTTIKIDISELQAGMYFIEVVNDSKSRVVKFVKQ